MRMRKVLWLLLAGTAVLAFLWVVYKKVFRLAAENKKSVQIQGATVANGQSSAAWKLYVCPACKRSLKSDGAALICLNCSVTYPVVNGIPDFILEDLSQTAHPILRRVRYLDKLAGFYESSWWYPLVLNVYAGRGSVTRDELVRLAREMAASDGHLILDAACGPGTLGRRLVKPSQEVYGIDVAPGMLHKGVELAQDERLANVHFARAKVESLPFPDTTFDAALCGGALHLLADPVLALREIGRTMKPGAPLVVTTFVAGDKGLMRYQWLRDYAEQKRSGHVFELPQLERYLDETGFDQFEPRTFGSFVIFRACKQ